MARLITRSARPSRSARAARTALTLLFVLVAALLVGACSDDSGADGSGDRAQDAVAEHEVEREERGDGADVPNSDTDSDADSDTGTAPAPEPGDGARVHARLEVRIELEDGAATGGVTRPTRLECAGSTQEICTGTIVCPNADDDEAGQRVCAWLGTEEVRTLLEPPAPDRVCTMQYGGPERARITGTLDGTTIDREVARTNGCGIAEWNSLEPLWLGVEVDATEPRA